jgi:hypothetical protein
MIWNLIRESLDLLRRPQWRLFGIHIPENALKTHLNGADQPCSYPQILLTSLFSKHCAYRQALPDFMKIHYYWTFANLKIEVPSPSGRRLG